MLHGTYHNQGQASSATLIQTNHFPLLQLKKLSFVHKVGYRNNIIFYFYVESTKFIYVYF